MVSPSLYIYIEYILPPPQCTCTEFSSFYSGYRVAIEWLSSGYRVAIEWLSCDGQQAATIPDLTTEFLMQSLEGFLQPQMAENDDVKRVRKHVEVKQSNLS